ncbi:hypothetical protein VNO80_08714 [Phaseolus coccineus]|uniref:Uncharacterized protein n=1 Tax=Phaseolus coccineus TaxID=3886 RepID=A0AAN9N5E0_PHACN
MRSEKWERERHEQTPRYPYQGLRPRHPKSWMGTLIHHAQPNGPYLASSWWFLGPVIWTHLKSHFLKSFPPLAYVMI